MLVIRREMTSAFREAARRHFEGQVLIHIKETFPAEVDRIGEDVARTLVSEGVRLAKGYAFENRRNVCFFVDLMFAFGQDFHTRLPWALAVLKSTTVDSEDEKRLRLLKFASEHPEHLTASGKQEIDSNG